MVYEKDQAPDADPHIVVLRSGRVVENLAGPTEDCYTAGFLDVTRGSDGVCPACVAGPGYDAPTGLGTPNAAALLEMLLAY